MTGLILALLAVACLAGALGLWFHWIRRVALAGRRIYAFALIGVGMGLAVAALAVGPGLAGGILAGLTLVLGALWFGLAAISKQSRQAPAVAVGDAVPDFTAPDEHGEPVRLADLRGQPLLLKFFRGHW